MIGLTPMRTQRGTAPTLRLPPVAAEDYAAAGVALAVAVGKDFAAASDCAASCRCQGLYRCRALARVSTHPTLSCPILLFLAQSSSFSTIVPVVRPFTDWVAPSPLSQHNFPPLS